MAVVHRGLLNLIPTDTLQGRVELCDGALILRTACGDVYPVGDSVARGQFAHRSALGRCTRQRTWNTCIAIMEIIDGKPE